MSESRVQKSLLNAKVNLIFYVLTLFLSFFSRKIFLDCLGADFVGLTGTLMNLLGFLNLAELGIGAAIGYVLYKPLFDKDQERICEIISVFAYLYRWIGFIILGLGCLLACFLPLIFPDTGFNLGVICAAYFSFLASSLIGYFVNYKQTLLGADQKNYVITCCFQGVNIAKTIVQMTCAYYSRNYYLWIIVELVFGLVYSFCINQKIRNVYPWLVCSHKAGKTGLKKNGVILVKARQLFVHLLAGSVRYQVLPFLIYSYTSLATVALYGNYMLICDKVSMLFGQALNSTGAGVGNLIAEGNKPRIVEVFWELTTIRYMIAAYVAFCLFYLIPDFIQIWLGESYLLDETILLIIIVNAFLASTRGTNEQFNYGYGLFHDTWAPLVTLLLTFGVACFLGAYWGLGGVILGDTASALLIICIWKPYLLFSRGFKMSVWYYWVGISRIAVAIIGSFVTASRLFMYCKADVCNVYAWVGNSLLCSLFFLISLVVFMGITNAKNMRLIFKRIIPKYVH